MDLDRVLADLQDSNVGHMTTSAGVIKKGIVKRKSNKYVVPDFLSLERQILNLIRVGGKGTQKG